MPRLIELFQGIHTLAQADLWIVITRLGLIILGVALVYLGRKGVLEPLLMIPMGFGMAVVNAGVLFMDPNTASQIVAGTPDLAAQQTAIATAQAGQMPGNLLLAPLVEKPGELMNILQIECFQPIYTFAFSNGLIACFVFMGIGVLLDVGYVMSRPFESMFLALAAELGTIATFPIATAWGLTPSEAASIAMVGGADGPMVLFTSLKLAPKLFVPITVVAYLYLGLTYGGYPFLVRAMVPKRLRMLPVRSGKVRSISSGAKLTFALITCIVLCLMFPVAAPLFLSLFVGVAVREAGLKDFESLIGGPLLYGSTFFLGLLLGILCEASTLLQPIIFKLLMLGITSLLLSGIGGILGGYVMYFLSGKKYNPVIGIAGVSCVPTTAKVAQKIVQADDPRVIIMPQALGANICGVITTAVICGIYVTMIPLMK
ncbi:MAG TPA: sodium ion-translocating decarboxylase subunit beta [Opitutaceae bacterium]|nr:sodium ion-translocating decarboxylase subunit beta [Opitutaceae bacterium]